jgi:hypothetical protein
MLVYRRVTILGGHNSIFIYKLMLIILYKSLANIVIGQRAGLCEFCWVSLSFSSNSSGFIFKTYIFTTYLG